MSEHSTLTDGSVDGLVDDAIRETERALAPLTPSPRQRELALRAASLRRAFDQLRRVEHGDAQLTALRDLAIALHGEAVALVTKHESYRRLRVWPSPPHEGDQRNAKRSSD